SKCALILSDSRLSARHAPTRRELLDTLQSWNQGRRGLLNGDAKLGLSGQLSKVVRAKLAQNEPNFQAINAAARALLNGKPTAAATTTILASEGSFLRGMEAVVGQLDRESSARVHALQNLQTVFLVAMLGVLWLEGALIFRPATQRVEAAWRELEHSKNRQRALFEALPDAILVFDDGGGLLESTPRHAQSLAGPMEIHFARHLKAARAVGQGKTFEFRDEEARRDYEARLVLLSGDAGRGGLAVVRDITEKKELERLKNEFVSTVSHELRTPLTSIRGALGLLSGGVAGELPPRAKPLIDVALSNCERLTRLVNDILDLENIQSDQIELKPETLALDQAVLRAVEANRAFAGQFGVQFDLDLQVRGYIRADEGRLAQILTNLLSNAAKFSHRGGTVQVVTTRRSDETGRWVRVLVQDNGPGIAPEFRSRIFGRFEQADGTDARANQGSGLGLAVARALTEKLDGRIGFDSEIGRGSTFWVEWRELTV
ncbi:MAG TPA: ATP-binding protein, partial [Abditibacterium sp.]